MERASLYRAVSVSIAMAFLVTLAGLDVLGRTSRVVGPAWTLGQERLPVSKVERSVDAYRIWREKGGHGRVVVALGRRLHFESPDPTSLLPRDATELKTFSLSRKMESRLDIRNFLYLAMEAGCAREMIHVLPESVYAEKVAAVQGFQGVRVTGQGIETTVLGSPRTITTLKRFRTVNEPVSLYIDASYFKDEDPVNVLAELRARNVRTDHVILSLAHDDEDVTERERERMRIFESQLGG